jgi:hypothetical protein
VPATGRDLAGRDQLGVDRRVAVRRQGQDVAHRAFGRAFAGDVEQGVIGQVDDGRLVGGRAVGDRQVVGLIQGVGRRGGERAGIAFLAVGADMGEGDRGDRAALDVADLPDLLVEALDPAVQGGDAVVVQGQLVGLAVEHEPALADAVGEAADRGPEIAGVPGVGLGVLEAQGDVGLGPVAAGRDQRLQGGAVGDHRGADALAIGQGYGLDLDAVGGLAERGPGIVGREGSRRKGDGGGGQKGAGQFAA